jgi:hypothetical protein
MTTSCIGIGRVFGHSMRPRYSVVPLTLTEVRQASTDDLLALAKVISTGTKRIYAGDVCTRCGFKVPA